MAQLLPSLFSHTPPAIHLHRYRETRPIRTALNLEKKKTFDFFNPTMTIISIKDQPGIRSAREGYFCTMSPTVHSLEVRNTFPLPTHTKTNIIIPFKMAV